MDLDTVFEGFSNSSHDFCNINLHDHDLLMLQEGSNLFHSPFYDPFDPSFAKLFNPEVVNLYSQTFESCTPNGQMILHGSQTRRLLDPGPFQQEEKKSCLILDNNIAKRKRNGSNKKEPDQQTRSRRTIIIEKKSDIIKGQWSADEDRLLEKLVEKHGVRKWSSIAQMLPGRIGKQCRERWHNHLKPNIKKDRWSDEEDRILIEAHRQVGNKWAEIARSLPGRSENTIKNHWNATKRRQLSSYRKNNSNINISPLQDYINKVMFSSSGSISPSNKPINMNAENNNHDQSLLDGMQFDFDQKEIDFMEMLSIGYI